MIATSIFIMALIFGRLHQVYVYKWPTLPSLQPSLSSPVSIVPLYISVVKTLL